MQSTEDLSESVPISDHPETKLTINAQAEMKFEEEEKKHIEIYSDYLDSSSERSFSQKSA